MLLAEILAYHGTGHKVSTLKPPIFLAMRQEDAEWYAYNRGDEAYIALGELDPGNVLDCVGYADKHPLLVIADDVDVEYTQDPYFDCPEISKHSPYDGGNISDLLYVPKIISRVRQAGYHSVKLLDVLTNGEIEAYVIFDPKRFKVTDTIKL